MGGRPQGGVSDWGRWQRSATQGRARRQGCRATATKQCGSRQHARQAHLRSLQVQLALQLASKLLVCHCLLLLRSAAAACSAAAAVVPPRLPLFKGHRAGVVCGRGCTGGAGTRGSRCRVVRNRRETERHAAVVHICAAAAAVRATHLRRRLIAPLPPAEAPLQAKNGSGEVIGAAATRRSLTAPQKRHKTGGSLVHAICKTSNNPITSEPHTSGSCSLPSSF